MALDGINRNTFNPKPAEPPKAKPEIKKTVIQNADNRNSVVGAATNTESFLKFKFNGMFDGIFTAKAPIAPEPIIDPAKKADELINNHGGANNVSDDGAYGIGRDIADLAKTDPDAAIVVMNQVQDKLKDTTRGDNVADGFAANSSDADLQSVASAKDGAAMLKSLQGHLLSGSVHEGEMKDASRFGGAINTVSGIFTDSGDGIGPVQANYVSPYYEKATPAEAASFLKYDTAFNSNASKAQAFAAALEIHKNDGEWTKNFLSAVGTKKAADYMSGLYSMPYSNKTQVNKYSDTMRTTLENLVNSGDLKQAGMDALVNQLKDHDPYVFTEIFGKSSNENFQQMFVKSAVANGDDRFDAAASSVLTKMSDDKQSEILTEFNKNGKLDGFIQGAMSGQTTMISLDYKLDHPGAAYLDAPKTTLGNVTQLLQTAQIQTAYTGSTLQQAPFSRDLQTALFNAASRGLDDSKAFENMKGDVTFKNALSEVFVDNRDQILMSNTSSENGAITQDGEKGLERFFQYSLMTPPRGSNYDALSLSVYSFVNDATSALSDPKLKSGDQKAFADFAAAHGGKSPEDYAQLLGGVLGTIVDGAGNAQVEINKDNKEKEAQIEFFTGLAFAMVPGAGSTLAKGISNEFVKHFAEKGAEYFQGKALDSIKDSINKGLSGLVSSKPGENGQLANTLYRQLLEKLPNGDAVYSKSEGRMIPTINLQQQLEAGFNNTTRYTLNDAAKSGN